MKQIGYSENESKVLGFKVGRLIAETSINENITAEIAEDAYDLVRVRMPAANDRAIFELKQIGFPFYFSGSIRKYKTKVANLPNREFFYPDINYEAYDGSQNELLYRLLDGTWGTYPLCYFKTPFLSQLVTKKRELDSVFEFYKTHNLPVNNHNNGIMFMKHKGNYVGFFALNIIDDRLESHIGGIVEPYRTSNYFVDMQEYIRRYCLQNNLKYFCFGARNENGRVQSIFQEFGYTAFATDNIFHVTPFLSLKNSSTKVTQLTLDKEINMIRTQLIDVVSDNFSENWECIMIKTYNLQGLSEQSVNMEATTIEGDHQATLTVVKINSKEGDLLSWAYVEGQYLM